jgi:hypothetical protein
MEDNLDLDDCIEFHLQNPYSRQFPDGVRSVAQQRGPTVSTVTGIHKIPSSVSPGIASMYSHAAVHQPYIPLRPFAQQQQNYQTVGTPVSPVDAVADPVWFAAAAAKTTAASRAAAASQAAAQVPAPDRARSFGNLASTGMCNPAHQGQPPLPKAAASAPFRAPARSSASKRHTTAVDDTDSTFDSKDDEEQDDDHDISSADELADDDVPVVVRRRKTASSNKQQANDKQR